MTGRERILRLFNHEEIDRVPIWLLSPFHKLSCYADIYELPSYSRLIPYINKYCSILDRRGTNTGFCFNQNKDIEYINKVEQDGDKHITSNIVKYEDIQFEKAIINYKGSSELKYFIEDADELEKILAIPYEPVIPDFSNYEKERVELGDKGVYMIDIGDPLTPLYSLMSAENFSMSTILGYDKILLFLDEMYKRCYALYKKYLEAGIGDIFFIVGAEFAGPPMVAPDKFHDLSAKYVKGIVDLIRSYGKKSIIHYHGNLSRILESMKYINPDGLHTIEAPPIGDCTIAQAREVLGDMVLIGNIQYDDLTRNSKEGIKELVKTALDEGKSGRFILSPTAGPYEDVISDKVVDNYITFIETGLKYGKY